MCLASWSGAPTAGSFFSRDSTKGRRVCIARRGPARLHHHRTRRGVEVLHSKNPRSFVTPVTDLSTLDKISTQDRTHAIFSKRHDAPHQDPPEDSDPQNILKNRCCIDCLPGRHFSGSASQWPPATGTKKFHRPQRSTPHTRRASPSDSRPTDRTRAASSARRPERKSQVPAR